MQTPTLASGERDSSRAYGRRANHRRAFFALGLAVLITGLLFVGAPEARAQVGTTFTTNTAVAPGATMTLAVNTAGVTIVTSSPVVGCPTAGLGTATVTYSCGLPPAVGIPQGTSISQTFSVAAGPISETVTYNANGPFAAVMAGIGNHNACDVAGVPMCNGGCSTPHSTGTYTGFSICGPVFTSVAVVPGGTLTLWVITQGEQFVTITMAPPTVGTCPLTTTIPTKDPGGGLAGPPVSVVYTCGGGQSIPSGTNSGVLNVTVTLGQAAPHFAAEANDNATSANPLPSADGIPKPTMQTVTVAAAAPTLATISPTAGPTGTSVTNAATTTTAAAPTPTAIASSSAAAATSGTLGSGTSTTPASTTASSSGSSSATMTSVPVSYGSGWNLVAGPAGSTISGSIGPLYSYQAGDTDYETVQAGATLKSGWGYWAYFNDVMGVTIATASGQTLSVPLPAGQWVMVGNPGSTGATVSGADVFYSYTAAGGYQATTTLGPGAAAWAYAGAGGTATISSP